MNHPLKRQHLLHSLLLVSVLGLFATMRYTTAQLGEDRYCGNDAVEDGEQCDGYHGYTLPREDCDSDCTAPVCGDSYINWLAGEECDDGNTDNNDGCASDCKSENPYCGNGKVDQGEECDPGNNVYESASCDSDCTDVRCGDGKRNMAVQEQCDDGNNSDGDGCDGSCREEFCGDGKTNNGEECDDGNTAESDGCSAYCRKEQATCGNWIVETGEQCDNGWLNGWTDCDWSCQVKQLCGNGQIDAGEVCDGGNLNGQTCTSRGFTSGTLKCYPYGLGSFGGGDVGCKEFDESECTNERCGNGTVEGSEQCDDGNTSGGDGCAVSCEWECGNGQIDAGEVCDGENFNGDSCTARGFGGGSLRCYPRGFGSFGSGDVGCREIDESQCYKCGDGNLHPGEDCDDGNTQDGDGCNSICKNECGNGQIDAGERCDTGMPSGGLFCDAFSLRNDCSITCNQDCKSANVSGTAL